MSKEKIDKRLGYWASQEQYAMQDLLKFVIEAEKNGFDSCLTSDHFHPWWDDNAFGNFTWIRIATAAERTKKCCHIFYPPKKKNNKKRKGNKYVEGNYRSTYFFLLLTIRGHNSSRRNIFGVSSSH